MDARDNNSSLTYVLLNNHRCGLAGPCPLTFVLRKYAIAFDGSRIIIFDDGPGAGTSSKYNTSRVAVMPVHNVER